jgi:Ca2+-transporting ATPase
VASSPDARHALLTCFQFQLTVNITAVLLTFVSAVASSTETSVLSAVQLLWVNLIMDTFAALALATDPPAPSILDRKPDPKSAPLITINMWKMIIGQAIYQLVVTFVLNFAGMHILGYPNTVHGNLELKALIFNTFVWMQIFNQYNNRRLDNKFNIFEGITRNWFFIGINFVMIGGQVMIIFIGGQAFSVTELNGIQWAISIILGAISLPVAVIIRLIPDEFVAKLLPGFMSRKRNAAPVYVSADDRFEWNRGIEEIRQELSFLKMVRGGRLNQLTFRRHDIRGSMKENFSHIFRSGGSHSDFPPSPTGEHPPQTSGTKRRRSRSNSAFAATVVMPSIIAGSVGGWSPIEKAPSPSTDGTGSLPFSSRGDLESQSGVAVHPDTAKNDPVVTEHK